MKKTVRIITITCIVCLLASIIALPTSAASTSIPRTVRIRNMWNSSYAANDDGIAKYSTSKASASCVWVIKACSIRTFTIMNWDGTYLRANADGTVTCESMATSADHSYQWTLVATDDGHQLIKSYAYENKAINIEHLTGSLELTTYYDTWESVKWTIQDIVEPAFNAEYNNKVIFQTPDQSKYLFNGTTINPLDPSQATINGNMLYEVINKGSYSYIKYSPASTATSNIPGYFKANSPMGYGTRVELDETSEEYRWIINNNSDGTVTIESVAYPNMCIANDGYSFVNKTTEPEKAKWNMKPANSFTLKIANHSKDHTLIANGESAVFKADSTVSGYGDEARWQAVFNGDKLYLRNVATGKYLRSSGIASDLNAYVTDYDADNDSLFVWEAQNIRYVFGLTNGNSYLSPATSSADGDIAALVGQLDGFGSNFLSYAFAGFTE